MIVLCEKCYPNDQDVAQYTIQPLSPCMECKSMENTNAFPDDPRDEIKNTGGSQAVKDDFDIWWETNGDGWIESLAMRTKRSAAKELWEAARDGMYSGDDANEEIECAIHG